ncbi:MAG: hypothetical protein IJW75_06375, partial [Alphaproteobacteria bacterium]|nr:hypothetical protein [Alphaproteobacteria bacterium]
MKKNGLKSFIFSFAVSLLAVFVVNKTVFHAPENVKQSKKSDKIIANNISLFSKPKIEVKKADNNAFKNMDTLVAEKSDIKTVKIVTGNYEPKIQTSENTRTIRNKFADVVYSPDDTTDKIEQIAGSTKNNNENERHKNFIDLASASELILEKETPVILKEVSQTDIKPVTDQKVVYSDISDTINDEKNLDNSKPDVAENITIAQAPISDNINDIEDIIPITENEKVLHDNIDVLNSAENTQIAMLDPEVLVNSIDSIEKPEEKNISEVNLNQEKIITNPWKQMSENESEDSPWVVAKGNRFAKNKIAQIDILAEEALEKEKKLKEKESAGETDAATESETVVEEAQNDNEQQNVEETSFNETDDVEKVSDAQNDNVQSEDVDQSNATNSDKENIAQTSSAPKENVLTVYNNNGGVKQQLYLPVRRVMLPTATPVFYRAGYNTAYKNIIPDNITPKPETANNEVSKNETEIIEEESKAAENDVTIADNSKTLLSDEDDKLSIKEKQLPKEEVKQTKINPKPLLVPIGESETKLAYKMLQNLIIPLPDDISSDADIIPQLSSEPRDNKVTNKIKEEVKTKPVEKKSKELNNEEKNSGLFKSISSWFSKNSDKEVKPDEKPQLSKKQAKKKK